jgi:hypothetical protein
VLEGGALSKKETKGARNFGKIKCLKLNVRYFIIPTMNKPLILWIVPDTIRLSRESGA